MATALLGWLSIAATAQAADAPPAWPSAEQVEAVRAARPMPTVPGFESSAPPRRGQGPIEGPSSVPSLGALPPSPATAIPLDIAELAAQGSRLGAPSAGGASTPARPAVQVFVTLQMPRASLERLVEQAERSGVTLVMRGLHAQSLRKTVLALGELIGPRRVHWVIDPKAFERYGVNRTPTFVVDLDASQPATDPSARPDGSAANAQAGSPVPTGGSLLQDTACEPASNRCSAADTFVSIAGDVSLDHALRSIALQAPEAGPVVASVLARLDKAARDVRP
jgi:conjugal transfer pilus assembly protein TrbC